MLNRAHGGNIWPYLKNPKKQIIDFSANVNPLNLPSKAKNVIMKNIDRLVHYPEPESKYLKKRLALFHNIPSHNLLIGNGSIELIYLVPKALKSKNILIPIPTFMEYEFAARALNRPRLLFVKSAEKNNFKIDVSKLLKFIPGSNLVFLCNPNNPTGSSLLREEILPLLYACTKKKVTLLIDEAFADFIQDTQKTTLIYEAVKNEYLLVLRSLTKFFALAGLRLGYLIGHRNTIKRLQAFQYPWSVNTLAQIVSGGALEDKAYIKRTSDFILKEKAYLFDNLSKIEGIKVYPSNANFFLCKLRNSRIQNAKNLSKKLIREGIIIRDCSNFRGLNNKFFRIAVRTREDNNKLIAALKDTLR